MMRSPARLASIFVFAIGLSIAGCSQSDGDDAAKEADPSSGKNKNSPAAKVTMQSVKHAEFLKELPKLKGKVVLIDFWGTWCPPCKAGFHKIVKLHEKYHEYGLVCVSVHVPGVDLNNEKIAAIEFLKQQRAVFPNFFLIDEGDDMDKLHKHWEMSGQPAYFVFDRRGRKAARFPQDRADFTIDDIEKAVQAELKKSA